MRRQGEKKKRNHSLDVFASARETETLRRYDFSDIVSDHRDYLNFRTLYKQRNMQDNCRSRGFLWHRAGGVV